MGVGVVGKVEKVVGEEMGGMVRGMGVGGRGLKEGGVGGVMGMMLGVGLVGWGVGWSRGWVGGWWRSGRGRGSRRRGW